MVPQRLLSKPPRLAQDTQQLATGSLAVEPFEEILCPGFRTRYVNVPSHVATDSAFPFADGETVLVRIEDGNIATAPTEDGAEDGA